MSGCRWALIIATVCATTWVVLFFICCLLANIQYLVLVLEHENSFQVLVLMVLVLLVSYSHSNMIKVFVALLNVTMHCLGLSKESINCQLLLHKAELQLHWLCKFKFLIWWYRYSSVCHSSIVTCGYVAQWLNVVLSKILEEYSPVIPCTHILTASILQHLSWLACKPFQK
jgi:hypothetical protein